MSSCKFSQYMAYYTEYGTELFDYFCCLCGKDIELFTLIGHCDSKVKCGGSKSDRDNCPYWNKK